jgi:hypothetical protein
MDIIIFFIVKYNPMILLDIEKKSSNDKVRLTV